MTEKKNRNIDGWRGKDSDGEEETAHTHTQADVFLSLGMLLPPWNVPRIYVSAKERERKGEDVWQRVFLKFVEMDVCTNQKNVHLCIRHREDCWMTSTKCMGSIADRGSCVRLHKQRTYTAPCFCGNDGHRHFLIMKAVTCVHCAVGKDDVPLQHNSSYLQQHSNDCGSAKRGFFPNLSQLILLKLMQNCTH